MDFLLRTALLRAAAPAAPAGGSQVETFDTASMTSLITPADSNRTAVRSAVSNGPWSSCITNGAALSGKQFWQVRVNVTAGTFIKFGVATVGQDVELGSYTYSAGYHLYPPSATDGSLGYSSSPFVVGLATDTAVMRLWVKGASGWVGDPGTPGDDPATGVGGMDISGLIGSLFPGVSLAETGDSVTHLAGTNITEAPPSGFTVRP